ncbi:MAG: helix-turn-helix domain-containing protein [Planctomycetota bacterium]
MKLYRLENEPAGFWGTNDDDRLPILELGEMWTNPDWPIRSHLNGGDEIYLQVRGSSRWQVGRTEFYLPEGGYYLIPAGRRHRLLSFSGRDVHLFFVVLRPGALRSVGLGHAEREWPNAPTFGKQGLSMRPGFEGLIREATLDAPWKAPAVRAHLSTVCVELLRLQRNTQSRHQPVSVHAGALRARELIEAKPGFEWTLESLSAIVALSSGHLLHVFRESYGLTPKQFLIQQRILRAKHRLRHSADPVIEIAMDLGFCSSQHLAGCFKSHVGVSPTDYRKSE